MRVTGRVGLRRRKLPGQRHFGKRSTASSEEEGVSHGGYLGVLTREVFRLEVTNSGYHKLLSQAIETNSTIDSLLESFRNHLGTEGRALARVMLREHRG